MKVIILLSLVASAFASPLVAAEGESIVAAGAMSWSAAFTVGGLPCGAIAQGVVGCFDGFIGGDFSASLNDGEAGTWGTTGFNYVVDFSASASLTGVVSPTHFQVSAGSVDDGAQDFAQITMNGVTVLANTPYPFTALGGVPATLTLWAECASGDVCMLFDVYVAYVTPVNTPPVVCQPGTQFNNNGVCKPITLCDPISAVEVLPSTLSATSDRTCQCKSGFFTAADYVPFSNGHVSVYTCSRCGRCDLGSTVMREDCTLHNDVVCNCPNNNFFQADPYTCLRCSGACPVGEYQISGCTANSDRVCAPCSGPCGVGQFADTPCSTWGDRTCGACDANCDQCRAHGKNNCIQCSDGFAMSDHHECVPCDVTCRTCTGNTNHECRSCTFPRYLNNGRCRL